MFRRDWFKAIAAGVAWLCWWWSKTVMIGKANGPDPAALFVECYGRHANGLTFGDRRCDGRRIGDPHPKSPCLVLDFIKCKRASRHWWDVTLYYKAKHKAV